MLKRALVGLITVADVHVKCLWDRGAAPGEARAPAADHQHGIADADFSMNTAS